MDANRQAAEAALDAQFEDFRQLHDLGLEQRHHIANEDLPALERSFARMHQVMDSIRLRQNKLPPEGGLNPQAREKRDELRHLILEIQALRQSNQESVECLLANTRNEIRQLGKGRRVARTYAGRSASTARLFDGTR